MPECRLLLLVLGVLDISNDKLFVSASKDKRCEAIVSTSADVIVRTGACNETGKSV